MSLEDQTDDSSLSSENQVATVDIKIIPEQAIVKIIPLPSATELTTNSETSTTKLTSPIVWDINQKSQYSANTAIDFFKPDTFFPPDAAHGFMDKWRYNFDIINGPNNIVFVDATLSYFDVAWGYHLEYNPNGILWKVNAAGTPAPQDSLNFEEQNRIIESTTRQTVAEVQAVYTPVEVPKVSASVDPRFTNNSSEPKNRIGNYYQEGGIFYKVTPY